VWATCLVFFQSVLLIGYAYSDWTTRLLAPRRQAWLHIALLAASLLMIPIIPEARWKPGADGGEPSVLILGLLGATIGLPYFLFQPRALWCRPGSGRASGMPCRTGCSHCRISHRCSPCFHTRCWSSPSCRLPRSRGCGPSPIAASPCCAGRPRSSARADPPPLPCRRRRPATARRSLPPSGTDCSGLRSLRWAPACCSPLPIT
jgi:hypothetical protein